MEEYEKDCIGLFIAKKDTNIIQLASTVDMAFTSMICDNSDEDGNVLDKLTTDMAKMLMCKCFTMLSVVKAQGGKLDIDNIKEGIRKAMARLES